VRGDVDRQDELIGLLVDRFRQLEQQCQAVLVLGTDFAGTNIPDELAVNHRLRRVLAALESQAALDLVLDKLRKTRTNIEFLMQVAKTTPGKDDD